MNKHWAVIPVKGLIESKTRLTSYLGESKQQFVEALLLDVLSSALRSEIYDQVVLISPDESVAHEAKDNNVAFVKQTGFGLNSAIEQANRLARRARALSLTTILADIPLVEPRDYARIFNLHDSHGSLVLGPSSKGGTNIMIGTPPGIVRPMYGRWSYSKHLRQAQTTGLDVYSLSNPRISFDIDTVEDLTELRRRDPDCRTKAARVLHDVRLLLTQLRTP